MQKMKLEYAEKDAERIVTGLLYSNPQTLEAFQRKYYSEKSESFQVQYFKYLTPDLELMGDNASSIIYKLSDDAQFILFSSREISAELSISLEQLYMIQLLKKGNIDGVLKQTDFLLHRVRNLISKELEYGREIAREPKIIYRDGFDDRSKRELEIRDQFEKEDENFQQMHTLLNRLIDKSKGLSEIEVKKRISEIRERLNQTTNKHAEFNTIVTKNIAFIIDIRTNRPGLLMRKSSKRFKEDLWEKLIKPEGITDERVLNAIFSPFFSPVEPNHFSIERFWASQKIVTTTTTEQASNEKEEVELKSFIYELDWQNILENWTPIMDELIEKTEFPIQSVKSMEGWTKDAVDLWLQFTREEFCIPNIVYLDKPYEDERQEFIRKLIEKDDKYRSLQGMTITVSKDFSNTIHYNESVLITDGTIHLKTLEDARHKV